jgi:hypothetical protein
MSALDALLHLMNFMLPAALLGGVAAGLAKLLWLKPLRRVAWMALAAWASAAALAAAVAGLAITGRDGTVLGYGAMVLACAAALGWAGWVRR